MNNQKIQLITRIAGITCLFLVIIMQVFKSQTYIPQTYLPYLTILSLVLLGISLSFKAKAGGFNHYYLPIKYILLFIVIVVVGIFLINYFTT